MKKVFQNRVCKGTGDCCRAVIASLFDKEMDEVPEFFPDRNQGIELLNYFESHGYNPTFYDRTEGGCLTPDEKRKYPSIEEVAKYDGGIGGYFYASVPSQTFDDVSHAVIVDTDLNVVHDPNPNQKCLNLKPEDVAQIIVIGNWHINLDGNLVEGE